LGYSCFNFRDMFRGMLHSVPQLTWYLLHSWQTLFLKSQRINISALGRRKNLCHNCSTLVQKNHRQYGAGGCGQMWTMNLSVLTLI
jgi:hypothetical protein